MSTMLFIGRMPMAAMRSRIHLGEGSILMLRTHARGVARAELGVLDVDLDKLVYVAAAAP